MYRPAIGILNAIGPETHVSKVFETCHTRTSHNVLLSGIGPDMYWCTEENGVERDVRSLVNRSRFHDFLTSLALSPCTPCSRSSCGW